LGSQELADKSGLTKKTIVQIDHGRQEPSFRTIKRLSQTPRCSIDFALGPVA
jgi:DNA-binding XRE family transcriptional regulator